MNNSHEFRPVIPAVPEDVERPLWSVMIPTYNCADTLRKTLANVLAQDPGPEYMQIEVVDDCSTLDDPQAVVEELGRGRVSFFRQPQNQGHKKNFETCLKRSRGKLVHLLHGDDYVLYGFYQKMQQAFEKDPHIGAAFCRYICTDTDGHWKTISRLERSDSGVLDNWLEEIAVRLPIQPPSMVVKRDVYEKVGGFDRRVCCCGEDWEMWTRIVVSYPIWFECEPLAVYRVSSSSLTGKCARSGQNIKDLLTIIEIFKPHLPDETADELTRRSRENWALWALYLSHQLIGTGDLKAATTQIQLAFKASCTFRVIRTSIFPMMRIFKRRLLGKMVFNRYTVYKSSSSRS